MEIRLLEVDRATIPLLLLLGTLAVFGYVLARRWPSTVWLILAGVVAVAGALAREFAAVSRLDLHSTLQRTVALEAVLAVAMTFAAIAILVRAALRARRRQAPDLTSHPRST
jgi:hypothetical protein